MNIAFVIAMYRRPKFLEILLDIRQEMARESDYDVDLFCETARSGIRPAKAPADITSTSSKRRRRIEDRDPVAK